MALFRRGLPRRAVVGAFIGFLYGALVMPTGILAGGANGTAVAMAGAGWGLLSISLLFGRASSYYVWVTWALLWVAWKGVEAFRGAGFANIFDILVPLVALVLLSSSGYLEHVKMKDDG